MGKPSRKHKNIRRPHAERAREDMYTLIPHSPAWFHEHRKHDPHKARMTKHLLSRAQRNDICSVCGDVPAPIFDMVREPWLPLRLCPACLAIRQDHFGEQFHPRDTHVGQGL